MANQVEPITSFSGEFRFLSNFWPALVWFEGFTYSSVEHAYVAAKTLSQVERMTICQMSSPGAVKRYGRKLKLRPDWELVKVQVMEDLLERKFQNVALRRLLHATRGRELIEGNTWGDTFWGVCNGVGENQLGQLLMKIRDSFPLDDEGNLL
jgi:ribA/ribD-fused uncharacterized protein